MNIEQLKQLKKFFDNVELRENSMLFNIQQVQKAYAELGYTAVIVSDFKHKEAMMWMRPGSKVITINQIAEYWKIPRVKSRQMGQSHWLSTDYIHHVALHEFTHLGRVPTNREWSSDSRDKMIAGNVSTYAQVNRAEFVAEYLTALLVGKKFDDEVNALYRRIVDFLPAQYRMEVPEEHKEYIDKLNREAEELDNKAHETQRVKYQNQALEKRSLVRQLENRLGTRIDETHEQHFDVTSLLTQKTSSLSVNPSVVSTDKRSNILCEMITGSKFDVAVAFTKSEDGEEFADWIESKLKVVELLTVSSDSFEKNYKTSSISPAFRGKTRYVVRGNYEP